MGSEWEFDWGATEKKLMQVRREAVLRENVRDMMEGHVPVDVIALVLEKVDKALTENVELVPGEER